MSKAGKPSAPVRAHNAIPGSLAAPRSVSEYYAAWLQARGQELAAVFNSTEAGDAHEDEADRAASDAWEIALAAISTPAAKQYEIAYKVEMLQWALMPGDCDRDVKVKAFAGILADLGD